MVEITDLLLDIVNYLISKGIVVEDGTDIFRDITPPDPDDIVVLNEYASVPTAAHLDCSTRSVQVLTRNISSDAAKKKGWDIYTSLINTDEPIQCIEGRTLIISPRCVPFRLSTDASNRVIWCFNLGILTYNKQ